MRKISLYTTNTDIQEILSSECQFDIELNSNSPSGDVCIIDCATSSDAVSYRFHPCIAIVDKSNCRVPFESDYVIQEPFDVSCIVRAIELLTPCNKTISIDDDIKHKITSLFEEIGMDPDRVGFDYAVKGVVLYLKSNGTFKFQDIFSNIAHDSNTTVGAVERAIRTAIEKAWQYGDIKKIYTLFGNSINPDKGKPSNAEFIAGVAQQFISEQNW